MGDEGEEEKATAEEEVKWARGEGALDLGEGGGELLNIEILGSESREETRPLRRGRS